MSEKYVPGFGSAMEAYVAEQQRGQRHQWQHRKAQSQKGGRDVQLHDDMVLDSIRYEEIVNPTLKTTDWSKDIHR